MFIKSFNVTNLIKDFSYPSIQLKEIGNIDVPLLELNEQNKIVEEILNIQKLIASKTKSLDLYDQLIKSRFIELFGDVATNSYGFDTYKIGSQFKLGAGGTPKTSEPKYWENGDISWIGSNLCQDVILYENDGKFITEEGFKKSSTKLLNPDTVLVALVGATIGKTALLKFKTTTNQNVLGIWGIVEAGYNPYYVFYYMQSIYHKFVELGDNGFKMASKAFVSELEILKPDITTQNVFAVFVKLIEKSKTYAQNQLNDLQELLNKKTEIYFNHD